MPSKSVSMHEAHLGHAFLWPFKWLAKLIMVVSGLALLVMTLFLMSSSLLWEGQAESFAAYIFRQAIESTYSGADPSLTTAFAQLIVRGLYWLFFEFTMLHQALERFADPTPVNMLDTMWRNAVIVPYQSEIRIAMWAIQVFGVRLAVILSVVPLLGITYAVAFSDGVCERYIRRACAGRESSGLYHRAKYLQLTAGAFCALLYLCAPWVINPIYTLLPFVMFVGLFARLQWKYYKKYL